VVAIRDFAEKSEGERVSAAPRVTSNFYKSAWFPWVLMAPALIILLVLGIFPFVYSLYLAVHNIILSKPYLETEFVGVYQFHELVQERQFLNALKVTAIFTFTTVFIEFWAGLGLALLFRRRIVGKPLFRLCILLPMVIPPVVVGLMWRYLLFPHSGLVTYYAGAVAGFFGLPAPEFLSAPSSALQTLIMIDVWQWTPFIFLILHAGLASLPPEPYEAAEIDGASAWRVFWTITLPMLKPSIMIALVIRTMDAFRTYDTIAVMTKGGPGNATETLNILLTNIGFDFFNVSKAAALSFIILVIIITLSFFFIRVFAKKPMTEA